ncbi:MAG: type III pantothenate kinase [Planctomycetia bacterium]|nr:type III pantothenate kinase [Planctomycetia bacterium]
MADALQDPRVYANLLILEIGNSHVSVATSIGPSVRTEQRFTLDQADEVVAYCETAWAALPEDHLRAMAAASVVPDALESLRERIEEALSDKMMVVGEDLQRPMSLAVEEPEMVGIDRVCAAAAAYDGAQAACAIASFGTAITIDCVNGEGVFMGGAILPGLRLQARALHEGTAALPQVEVVATGSTYGASTQDAISNGILYGVVGALREIVERYATELGSWPLLIATGGTAELVGGQCDFIDRTVPDLCIRGIGLAYRKHFTPLTESW